MSDYTVYDLPLKGWTTANDDGLWCNFCGELLVAAWNVDECTEHPECCPTCGGPDDIEAMTDYFT